MNSKVYDFIMFEYLVFFLIKKNIKKKLKKPNIFIFFSTKIFKNSTKSYNKKKTKRMQKANLLSVKSQKKNQIPPPKIRNKSMEDEEERILTG